MTYIKTESRVNSPEGHIFRSRARYESVKFEEKIDETSGFVVYEYYSEKQDKVITQVTFPYKKDKAVGTGFTYFFDIKPNRDLTKTEFNYCTLSL